MKSFVEKTIFEYEIMKKLCLYCFCLFITLFISGCDKQSFFMHTNAAHTNVVHTNVAHTNVAHTNVAHTNVVHTNAAVENVAFGKVRESEAMNIGVLLPLSGTHSALGNNMLDALKLASVELADSQIKISVIDAGSSILSMQEAVQELKSDETIDLIIGPMFDSQLLLLNEYARESQLTQIALLHDLQYANTPNLLMLGMPVEEQVTRILEYAVVKAQKKIFYAVIPKNTLGEMVLSKLQEYKDNKSINDFFYVEYDAPLNQKELELKKSIIELDKMVKNGNHDLAEAVLLLPTSSMDLYHIAHTIAKEKNLLLKRMQVVCNSNFHDCSPYTINWQQPWFADVEIEKQADFVKRFREMHKRDPHCMAAVAYDAIALSLGVMKKTDKNTIKFDPKLLLNKAGFEGVGGVFRFKKDRSLERMFGVFEAHGDKIVTLEAPLDQFK